MQASTSVLEALENISPQCPQPHWGRQAKVGCPSPPCTWPISQGPYQLISSLQTVPEGPRAGTELTAPWKEDLPAA